MLALCRWRVSSIRECRVLELWRYCFLVLVHYSDEVKFLFPWDSADLSSMRDGKEKTPWPVFSIGLIHQIQNSIHSDVFLPMYLNTRSFRFISLSRSYRELSRKRAFSRLHQNTGGGGSENYRIKQYSYNHCSNFMMWYAGICSLYKDGASDILTPENVLHRGWEVSETIKFYFLL